MTWIKFRKRVERWLRWHQPQPINVIIIGIGYPSHKLSQILVATNSMQLIACIDEDPWSHRTLFQGVPVHYPSELIALAEKHRVDLIIDFDGESSVLDKDLIAEIANAKTMYCTLGTSDISADTVSKLLKELN